MEGQCLLAMVQKTGNNSIIYPLLLILICLPPLEGGSHSTERLDPSFQFSYSTTEIDASVDSIGSFNGVISNSSSGSITVAVVRRVNSLSEGWSSSICVGSICYSEFVDSVSVDLGPGDSTICGVLIWTNGEGEGLIQIDLFDLASPNDHVIVDLNIHLGETASSSNEDQVSEDFRLLLSYPNPFNSSINISYIIYKYNNVSINIYDLNGNSIKQIINYNMSPGHHDIKWDATDQLNRPIASGMYFYKVSVSGINHFGRMLYLK